MSEDQEISYAKGMVQRAISEHGFSYVTIQSDESIGTLRVANNRVTENTEGESAGVTVVGALQNRLGITGYANTHDEEFWSSILRTFEIANNSPPISWFEGFIPYTKQQTNFGTRSVDSDGRVSIVAPIIDRFAAVDALVSGVCASTKYSYVLKSSQSLDPENDTIEWRGAQLYTSLAATDPEFTIEVGIESVGTSPGSLGLVNKVDQAVQEYKLQRDLPVREVPPGTYNAVFGGNCFTHLLQGASWYGLNGALHGREQTFCDDVQIGEPLFGKNITISDDPMGTWHRLWVPTDLLGYPRQYRALVKRGILKNRWYDLLSAQKFEQEPTGHGHSFGYGPSHLRLWTGDGPTTLEDAAKELGEGLVVSSMNYTRLVDSNNGSFTGLTRFGTYIVEDGTIVARAPNLRFIESIPRAFNNVDWLSAEETVMLPPEIVTFEPQQLFNVPVYGLVRDFQITGSMPIEQVTFKRP